MLSFASGHFKTPTDQEDCTVIPDPRMNLACTISKFHHVVKFVLIFVFFYVFIQNFPSSATTTETINAGWEKLNKVSTQKGILIIFFLVTFIFNYFYFSSFLKPVYAARIPHHLIDIADIDE